MRTLLLARHAKSSWDDPDQPDHDRPLNRRGKRDAPRMGTFLRKEQLVPDLILSSTAKRARRTAAKLAESCGYSRAIELRSELYGADPSVCVEVLRQVYHDVPCVMLIGHNPCAEELLEALTGAAEPLPTAAIAHIELPVDGWRQLTIKTLGRLVQIWRPSELD